MKYHNIIGWVALSYNVWEDLQNNDDKHWYCNKKIYVAKTFVCAVRRHKSHTYISHCFTAA
jgi:hypothetical protein